MFVGLWVIRIAYGKCSLAAAFEIALEMNATRLQVFLRTVDVEVRSTKV